MAWDMQHGERNIADHQFIPVLEQTVELRAVALELGTFIEDFSEDALHRPDLAPACKLTAKFLLPLGRARPVVAVRDRATVGQGKRRSVRVGSGGRRGNKKTIRRT